MVINSGNGAVGPTLDAISKRLAEKGVQTNFVFVYHSPDPTFQMASPTVARGKPIIDNEPCD